MPPKPPSETVAKRAFALSWGMLGGAVALLSGMAALIWEMLWFRLASLAFGQSIWASSLVLMAFMLGLAGGNAWAAHQGTHWLRLGNLYVRLEILIGVSGWGVVWLLPWLSGFLAPLWRILQESPNLLQIGRFSVALGLMLLPTTAMGMTLPLLVQGAHRSGQGLGRSLGWLYGWNTFGALIGVLWCEWWLLEWFGVWKTGAVALGLNLLAAAGAWLWFKHPQSFTVKQPSGGRNQTSLRWGTWEWVSAGTGACLLALEVVWFRFLKLFILNSGEALAWVLAVVLLGIAGGGWSASALLKRWPALSQRLGACLALSGLAVIVPYWGFQQWLGHNSQAWFTETGSVIMLALGLMGPACWLSGVIFTLLGERFQTIKSNAIHATGQLTFANTLGAAFGAGVTGFWGLPILGMERCFFGLAAFYAMLACGVSLAERFQIEKKKHLKAEWLLWLGLLGALGAFPWGLMNSYWEAASRKFRQLENSQTIAIKEGLIETLQYLRTDFLGQPLHYRMLSNGFSMSSTARDSLRYMKLFAYWPAVLHAQLRQALLISYGVGSTAQALTQIQDLERIEVVDLSPEVLHMSHFIFPAPARSPLDDPRVITHVEDGRHFLQVTSQRFDLITAEPPPPRVEGVINLYTKEYFSLLRERLNEGGLVTYWLPVDQMQSPTALAILKAFCEVFPDCSLWAGSNYNWMMIGTRHLVPHQTNSEFFRAWNDPILAKELREIGIETPELLGTAFLADASQIAEWTREILPLSDDYPKRLQQDLPREADLRQYAEWMDDYATEARFGQSKWIEQYWPPELRQQTFGFFLYQPIVNNQILLQNSENFWAIVQIVLGHSQLQTPVLWLLGSGWEEQRILMGLPPEQTPKEALYHRAVQALAVRDFLKASELLEEYRQIFPNRAIEPHLLALCFSGQRRKAWEEAQAFYLNSSRLPFIECWEETKAPVDKK